MPGTGETRGIADSVEEHADGCARLSYRECDSHGAEGAGRCREGDGAAVGAGGETGAVDGDRDGKIAASGDAAIGGRGGEPVRVPFRRIGDGGGARVRERHGAGGTTAAETDASFIKS